MLQKKNKSRKGLSVMGKRRGLFRDRAVQEDFSVKAKIDQNLNEPLEFLERKCMKQREQQVLLSMFTKVRGLRGRQNGQ